MSSQSSVRMLIIGILCVASLWIVSSATRGSNPQIVISANTGLDPDLINGLRNNPKISVFSCHGARVINQSTHATNINTIYTGLSVYNRPIIISDDGWNGAGQTQCVATDMWACLRDAMFWERVGCNFEHLDSCESDSITVREESGNTIPERVGLWPSNTIDCLNLLKVYGANNILTYPGYLTVSGNQLYWNDSSGTVSPSIYPIRLVGFSDFGTVAAGPNIVNMHAYLDILASFHVNFTRIFVVDPWSNNYAAVFPFLLKPSGKYDLSQKYQGYFDRLRDFVTYAAQKKIIVHITVFDRCGLKTDGSGWAYNPYKKALNVNGYFSSDYQFINVAGNPTIAGLHSSFISWVLSAISGCGNVILEIMNEPVFNDRAVNFHQWVANQITP